MKFLLLLLAALPSLAGCFPVDGDRITGRDLAIADAQFSPLPASVTFGYAPAVGSKRVFATAELQQIARSRGFDFKGNTPICFAVPIQALTDAEIVESMRRSLPAGAAVRIVEKKQADAPRGKIEFPLSGLEPVAKGSSGGEIWRGFVQYTDTRRVPLEIRVALTLPPAIVQRGDSVQVEVQSGLARLRFDAIAQSKAHAGEIVELRNPITGKIFRARIGSDSKAVVVVGKGSVL